MIQILDENNFFLTLYKPAGVSVHNQSPSLLEFLQAKKKPIHFVNRLDQETSGLMIVATQPEFHQPLADALDKGQKIYRALLRGSWKPTQPEIVLNWPLTDKSEGRKNPQGLSQDRKSCETHLKMLRSSSYFTEVLAEIKTGRQHQIRKHCALLKAPIVGDDRYNDRAYNQKMAGFYQNQIPWRLFLHAEKLQFNFRNKNYFYEKAFSLDAFFKEKPPSSPDSH